MDAQYENKDNIDILINPNHRRKIIITGSNRGIGYQLAVNLGQQNQWKIILACRDVERAEKVKQQIKVLNPQSQVSVYQLDLSSQESIKKFIKDIEAQGKIDVIINNSGIKIEQYNSSTFHQVFKINFYATIELNEMILPLMKENGKIIFVGSRAGMIGNLKTEQIKNQFRSSHITKERLFYLVKQYERSIEKGNSEEIGFIRRIYGMSKLGINVFPKIMAKYQQVVEKNIQVYSMCPGYVRTDMGGPNAPLSLIEGIQTQLYLINLPFEIIPQFQGKFFYLKEVNNMEQPFNPSLFRVHN